MPVVMKDSYTDVIGVTDDNGNRSNFTRHGNKSGFYYDVVEMNIKCNEGIGTLYELICNSSKDIKLLNQLLRLGDNNNKIVIANISKLANKLSTSRENLTRFLTKAVKANLLFKQDTGIYLINSYKWMTKGVTSAGLEAQEMVQLNWLEVTGQVREIDRRKLKVLSNYLELDFILPPKQINIDMAKYYSSQNKLSDKQIMLLLFRNNDMAKYYFAHEQVEPTNECVTFID